ncbi:Pyrimidodiazepine synthase [Smittium mucronatum]|uniref:Pyrimidodiazepine synthase n=1 Tax=Smittium mucronatum TaxID=133383 RepID=A0A1R0GMT9_9FUNG|nr:Pyrimidodiazepine synthase [Smittium mucronatum]
MTYNPLKTTLFRNRVCPFVQRVSIALEETKMNYDTFDIDPKNKPDWYKTINPQLKVPALRLPNGTSLVESALIVDYISEVHPEAFLYPLNPLDKYKVRLFGVQVTEKLVPLTYRILTVDDGAPSVEHREKVLDILKLANDKLNENSNEGPYFLGEQYSVADLLLSTFAYRTEIFSKLRGDTFENIKGLERYYVWKEAVSNRPSFIKTIAPFEVFKEAYEGSK